MTPPPAPESPSLRLSVAMATYNGARFLPDQLRSLSAQSLKPDELVVSDDGSSDTTLAIIRDFAQTAPFPVRILDKPSRLGFGDNFLFAVEHCRGRLVALCDQDDVWLPTKLEVGVDRLEGDASLLSMHRLTMTDEALRPTGLWNQGIASDYCWTPGQLAPLSGWGNTMVVRRELALLVPRQKRPWDPLYNRPLSHDTWLYILAAATGNVSHIAEPLILYRQHGTNAAGMRKLGLHQRLRAAVTVPLSTYVGLAAFFNDVAGVFDQLDAGSAGSTARTAALRYRNRAARAMLRARLYQERTASGRLRAFAALHAASNSDTLPMATRLLSLTKDLALGVTGSGYRA